MTNKLINKINAIKSHESEIYSKIINDSNKIKELLQITEEQFTDIIDYKSKFEIKLINMNYKIILSTQKLDFLRDLFFILPNCLSGLHNLNCTRDFNYYDFIIRDDTISSFIFLKNDEIKERIMQELENGNYEIIAKYGD